MSFLSIIFTSLFWCIFATTLACMEIESEGKYGWAEKMPTWFRTTGFVARGYGLFMGGKPLTGYHLFAFILPVLLFHGHFAMGMPWSPAAEFKAWAMYFGVCPMWDYHWFVLNPAYKGKFTRRDVWWHNKSIWVFGLFPMDYLVGYLMSFLCIGEAAWLLNDQNVVMNHGLIVIGFGLYTVGLHLAAPRYHRWYYSMRKRDDRMRSNMFHTLDPDEPK